MVIDVVVVLCRVVAANSTIPFLPSHACDHETKELGTLVIVSALARLSFVYSTGASNEDQFVSEHIYRISNEDDITSDYTMHQDSLDHSKHIQKRSYLVKEKEHEPPSNVVKSNSTEKPVKESMDLHAPDEKRWHRINSRQESDVYDREDHITQYLSDHMINTDSEITSLQAIEPEDFKPPIEIAELNEDTFFALLTDLKKNVDFEGDKPLSASDGLIKTDDPGVNDITDIVYKH